MGRYWAGKTVDLHNIIWGFEQSWSITLVEVSVSRLGYNFPDADEKEK